MRVVYLDYNATTPLDPEVKKILQDDIDVFANASSMHEAGRYARSLIETARSKIAKLIHVKSQDEIYFTSGGSESNNTVFNTAFLRAKKIGKNEVITTAIEHPCVLNAAKFLESEGFKVTFLPVDSFGMVNPQDLQNALTDKTFLVSIMTANNEIGTIQDIPLLAKIAHEKGAYFHTDATQALGKMSVDLLAWNVDYATFSSHKLYGPKGIGALYVKKGSPIEPLIRGGHQEHGVRSGTYNNASIIGFGKACEVALANLADYEKKLRTLRNKLKDGIVKAIPAIKVNGHPEKVLANTLNVSFPGAEGEAILLYLDLSGIQVSTGSACASGSLDPSHVLMATGVGPELAHGSIRFSLGKQTTEEDINYVLEQLPPIIARLRSMSTVGYDEYK